jgi:hypothetical protein
MLLDLVLFLLAPLLAAWLLSQASDRILAAYPRKVLFFSALGLLLALVCDVPRFGIGGYPPQDALVFAANRLRLLSDNCSRRPWRCCLRMRFFSIK